MATFSTLEECERVSAVMTSLEVQHKQKILKGKNVEQTYAIILLDDVDKILALDEYEDAINKAGWPG